MKKIVLTESDLLYLKSRAHQLFLHHNFHEFYQEIHTLMIYLKVLEEILQKHGVTCEFEFKKK